MRDLLLKDEILSTISNAPSLVTGCTGEYIGITTMTHSKRISCHVQEGNIHSHFADLHNVNPDSSAIVNSTKIIDYSSDYKRVRFLEALHMPIKNLP